MAFNSLSDSYNNLVRTHSAEMNISSYKASRTHSGSIDRYILANNNNLPHKINGVEFQVRPTSSKNVFLNSSNATEIRNDNLQLNYIVDESIETKYSINNNSIIETNNQYSYRHDSPSVVKPQFVRCKDKLFYNRGNLSMAKSLPVLNVIGNEVKGYSNQSLHKRLNDSVVQNVNKNSSMVMSDISDNPVSVEVLSIPSSESNKSCLSNHYLNTRITTQPHERILQTQMKISQNQGTRPESLTLKKLQLAARAEQLRIAEEIVKKKEEEAQVKTWQALQEQEAALLEKERVLELREKAAQKEYNEALKLIEESRRFARCKRLKLSEPSVSSNPFENTCTSEISMCVSHADESKTCSQILEKTVNNTMHNSSEKHKTMYSQPKNISEKFVKSIGTCNIMPYNMFSDQHKKTGGRKPKKKVLALDMCKVEPRLELSSLKHTYSRKSPKKRFEDTKSNDSNYCNSHYQPHNFKLSMQHDIDLPGSSRTVKEQVLISDSGTITITPISKFDQPLRPFSAAPRLSSLWVTEKSEDHHVTSSPVLSCVENCPSRISMGYSPSSSSSDFSVSFAEKVEKLTSDLQFHSLTGDKDQETFMHESEYENKSKVSDISQDNDESHPERFMESKSDQINNLRNYNVGSKEMFYQIVPHNCALNTDYSTPIIYKTSKINLGLSNMKASREISTSICDASVSVSVSKHRDDTSKSFDYQTLNNASSVDFTANSANPGNCTEPSISKIDFCQNKHEDKVTTNYEHDTENRNSYIKPNAVGNWITSTVVTQEPKSSLSKWNVEDQSISLTLNSLENEERSMSHLSVTNDAMKSNAERLTNEKAPQLKNMINVKMGNSYPSSQSFISFKEDHEQNIEYESHDTYVHSPETERIKFSTNDHQVEQNVQNSFLSNEECIDADLRNVELSYEKDKAISKSCFSSFDTQNALNDSSPSLETETNLISSDEKFLIIENDGVQKMSPAKNLSERSTTESEDVQTQPLDLGVEKEIINQTSTASILECAENIKREGSCFSKMEVTSPSTSFGDPCVANCSNQEYYSSNVIYTSPTSELIPSCSTSISTSYLTNFNDKVHPVELIYTGNLGSEVKDLNINFSEMYNKKLEGPVEHTTSHFSVVNAHKENSETSSQDASSLDISIRSDNSKNFISEINTENLDTSALFHTSGQKSFNLLSSSLLENCEEGEAPNSPSENFEEINSVDDCVNIAEEKSLIFCNNNNNSVQESSDKDQITSRGGRILKLKDWWLDVTADVQPAPEKDRKDKSKSVVQPVLDNDDNTYRKSSIKPRKKRGRKKSVGRDLTKDDSKFKRGRTPRKKCIWMANIIPATMKNQKSFECGKCCKIFCSVETFKCHAYSIHNGLVRPKGESQEFDESFINEMLNIVFKVKKRLLCDSCNKAFKSILGYKYHVLRCGKALSDFYTNCSICNKRLLATSMESHKMKHDNRLRLKIEKKSLDIKRKSSLSNAEEGYGRKTRRAAKSCHNQMKLLYESIDSGGDDANDKDFIGEEEMDKYFSSSEMKSPDNSHKFDIFNKNITDHGKSPCINEDCDVVFKDIKHLKLHLRTCSKLFSYITCKLCYSTIREPDASKHIEEYHKDSLSNYSDDLSDEDESCSGINFCKTSKVHVLRSVPYQQAREMTKNYRKINYADKLYTAMQCHPLEWIEVSDAELHLYQSQLSHSPLFNLREHLTEEREVSWERLQSFDGKLLGSSEIFYVGGPVQSSAWCPIPVTQDAPSQYIALSCINNPDQVFPMNRKERHNGLLQIWHCGKLIKPEVPELSLCIAHENGVIWSMDWCPSGIYENPSNSTLNNSSLNRLGMLAAAFSDGIIRIYLIPHPYQIANKTKIFKKNPEYSLCPYDYENLDLQCVKICWCPAKSHSLIAGSFTNGMVCIWNLNCASSLLNVKDNEGNTKVYPINSISAHNGICSAVSFFPKTEGRHIVTGGRDRTIKFWDLTQPEHPLNVIKKGIVTDSLWLPHWAGSFFSFDDAYSLSKTTTTFRENGFYGSTFRSILGTNATVWSISGSDWLNAVVQADEAGEVILSLQHDLSCEIPGEKHMSKKRFPLFSVKLKKLKEEIALEEASQSDNMESSGKEDNLRTNEQLTDTETDERSQHFVEQPLTYATTVNEYGIKFYDEDYKNRANLNETYIRSKQCSEFMEPGPLTIYPLMGSSSISWNNNFGTHTWIFVGFNSGLGRVVRIPFVE